MSALGSHIQPDPGHQVSPVCIAVAPAARALAADLSANVPVLRTARLVLRAPVLEDFATYAAIVCGPGAIFSKAASIAPCTLG